MTPVVFYKSISGFTEKYARWIGEALDCPVYNLNAMKNVDLRDFDVIIYGGSLHASGLNGLKSFLQYYEKIAEKKLFLFAVGASPCRKNIPEIVREHNLENTLLAKVPLFYFRGGYNFSKLDIPNKILMYFFTMHLKRKKNRTEDDEGMIQGYDKPFDFTDKESIQPLLEAVRKDPENVQEIG